MMRHLFARGSDSNKELFIVGVSKCSSCENRLGRTAVHYYNPTFHGQKNPREGVFCQECAQNLPSEMMVFGKPELRIGIVIDKKPLGAIPVVAPVILTTTRTIQDAETERPLRVIDRTRYAGRDMTLDGTEQIGKSEEALRLDDERKNELLTQEGVEDFLLSFTPTHELEDKSGEQGRLGERK